VAIAHMVLCGVKKIVPEAEMIFKKMRLGKNGKNIATYTSNVFLSFLSYV
jgi:hypothetical protein